MKIATPPPPLKHPILSQQLPSKSWGPVGWRGGGCTVCVPQDKFLDLVSLVLTTTCYTFDSQFYQQTDGVATRGQTSSTATKNYKHFHAHTAISMALHPTKVWERFVGDVCSILKRNHFKNFFCHISNLHQNIKCTMDVESKGKLAFLDTSLKQRYGKLSVMVYNIYTTALTTKQAARKVLFSPCLIEHNPLSQIKVT